MKKTFFFFLLVSLLGVNAKAQKLSIGINGGISRSHQIFTMQADHYISFYEHQTEPIDDYDVFHKDAPYFPTFGVFGQYSLGKRFGIQLDINYQHKEVTFKQYFFHDTGIAFGNGADQEFFITNRYGYLQFDLLPKYYLVNKKLKTFMSVGPYLAFLTSASSNGSYDVNPYTFEDHTLQNGETVEKLDNGKYDRIHNRTKSLKGSTASIDFGLQAGAGFELGRFGIEYRYSYGLMDIYKETNPVNKYIVYNTFHQLKLSCVLFRFLK